MCYKPKYWPNNFKNPRKTPSTNLIVLVKSNNNYNFIYHYYLE